MIVDKNDLKVTKLTRYYIVQAFVPLLDTFSKPVFFLSDIMMDFREIIYIKIENDHLRQENTILKKQLEFAQLLKTENIALRDLLNFHKAIEFDFISARVIADSFGPFMRSVLINVGNDQGIHEGETVIADQGLVGKAIEVGPSYARVLFVTDLNSRIPVEVENTGQKAILAGNNTGRAELLYLPDDYYITPGMTLVTSGDGDVFPNGIPVGKIVAVTDDDIRVQPYVNLDQLEYVSVLKVRDVSVDHSADQKAEPTTDNDET